MMNVDGTERFSATSQGSPRLLGFRTCSKLLSIAPASHQSSPGELQRQIRLQLSASELQEVQLRLVTAHQQAVTAGDICALQLA